VSSGNSDFAPYWMQDRPEPSFPIPLDDPGTSPDAAPTVCVPVNALWQPILAGCALQVALPASWHYADQDQLDSLMMRATMLVNLIAFAGPCMTYQERYTADCTLQFSLDGGTTWANVPGWVEHFPDCVRTLSPRLVMADGTASPPIPVWTDDGTDWVYTG
jgi:hypothetical protein